MSIEQKVGQTCQITLDAIYQTDEKGQALNPVQIDPKKLDAAINTFHVGSILNVGAHTLSRDEWTSIMSAVHLPYLKKETNIPILYGIDAIHGVNYTIGGTLFPQEIGLAATWNPALAEQMGQVTAYECRSSGIPWNFSPVLDLGRQPLWSRHFETLGEDPYLCTQMGAALVKGYQGSTKEVDNFHVAACLKHFVGYSASFSGRSHSSLDSRKIHARALFSCVQRSGGARSTNAHDQFRCCERYPWTQQLPTFDENTQTRLGL